LLLAACSSGNNTQSPDAGPATTDAAPQTTDAATQPSESETADGGNAEWDAIVAAAQQEGTVTLYNGFSTFPAVPPLIEAFEAATGIQVESIDGRASDLVERLHSESTAGNVAADVYFLGSCSVELPQDIDLFAERGDVDFPNLSTLGDAYAAEANRIGRGVPMAQSFFALLANDDQVPAGTVTSWRDLLDPQWTSKLVSDSMSAAGGGSVWAQVMNQNPDFGTEFMTSLAAQNPIIGRDLTQNARDVASGQFAMYYPYGYYLLPTLEGLPVHMIVPEEGLPYVLAWATEVVGAPHSNAAKVFLDFILSPEGQKAFVDNNMGAVSTAAAPVTFEGQTITPMAPQSCADVTDQRAQMAQIFGE
jgi:iron(III) transport system substrate-binding protein